VEEMSEQKPVLHFIDAKGRIWSPSIDCRVMDEFEKFIGIGIFEAVFNALLDLETKDGNAGKSAKNKKLHQDEMKKIAIRMSSSVFGRFGSLAFLLYEACKPNGSAEAYPVAHYADPDKSGGLEGKEVDYDDFRSSIKKEQVNAAMVVAINSLFEFFPNLDTDNLEERGRNVPFGLSLGGTSLNEQQ